MKLVKLITAVAAISSSGSASQGHGKGLSRISARAVASCTP